MGSLLLQGVGGSAGCAGTWARSIVLTGFEIGTVALPQERASKGYEIAYSLRLLC